MRRIFGGNNVTSASPSEPSNASLSPSLTSGSSPRLDHQPPLTPTSESNYDGSGGALGKKSWFGTALNGVGVHVGGGGGGAGAGAKSGAPVGGGGEARPPVPVRTMGEYSRERELEHRRDDSAASSESLGARYSTNWQAQNRMRETGRPPLVAGGQGQSSNSVDTVRNGKPGRGEENGVGGNGNGYQTEVVEEEELAASSVMDSSLSVLGRMGTVGEEKDNFMLELLSGLAIVDSKEYEILDWDELEATKKVSLLIRVFVWIESRIDTDKVPGRFES